MLAVLLEIKLLFVEGAAFELRNHLETKWKRNGILFPWNRHFEVFVSNWNRDSCTFVSTISQLLKSFLKDLDRNVLQKIMVFDPNATYFGKNLSCGA